LIRSTTVRPTSNPAPTTIKLNGTTCTVEANPAVAPINTVEALVAHIATPGSKSSLEPYGSRGQDVGRAVGYSDGHAGCRKPVLGRDRAPPNRASAVDAFEPDQVAVATCSRSTARTG
jgi:hypothetical protein